VDPLGEEAAVAAEEELDLRPYVMPRRVVHWRATGLLRDDHCGLDRRRGLDLLDRPRLPGGSALHCLGDRYERLATTVPHDCYSVVHGSCCCCSVLAVAAAADYYDAGRTDH
jgi:hypothetical protein